MPPWFCVSQREKGRNYFLKLFSSFFDGLRSYPLSPILFVDGNRKEFTKARKILAMYQYTLVKTVNTDCLGAVIPEGVHWVEGWDGCVDTAIVKLPPRHGRRKVESEVFDA